MVHVLVGLALLGLVAVLARPMRLPATWRWLRGGMVGGWPGPWWSLPLLLAIVFVATFWLLPQGRPDPCDNALPFIQTC